VVSPTLNSIVACIVANMNKWNALPQDIKEIIERDTPNLFMAFGSDFHMQEKLIWANAQREYGLKAAIWSEKDTQTVTDICIKQLWPQIGAKSANCTKLVNMVVSQSKFFGKIK
jgi:hypothetical protein